MARNKPLYWVLTLVLALLVPAAAKARGRTENIILITLDGARTQEIFGGLDLEALRSVTKNEPVEETIIYKKYWAPNPELRREKLMPFFWGTLLKRYGSIAGDRNRGSTVQVTNNLRFSYPGYSEILTGQAHDEVINSNDKKRNPFPTVLEFLKRKLRLRTEQVAAFASWETIDWIDEHDAGTITSNAGFEAYAHPDPTIRLLSKLQFETATPWNSVRHDAYTFSLAMAHLKMFQPRVLYLSLGETDDWAHDARYDRVLEALNRTDAYLKVMWEYLQSQGRYRNKTTILVTTDHGRGSGPVEWQKHGEKVEGAQYIWLAMISPDSAMRGEWTNTATIYQNQIAATLCRTLNLDYSENNPLAGKPIARLFEQEQTHP